MEDILGIRVVFITFGENNKYFRLYGFSNKNEAITTQETASS